MRKVLLIAVAFIVLFSCGTAQKDGDKNFSTASRNADYTKSAKVYMPLAIGNKWTYSVDYMGQKGEISVEIEKKDGEWFVDNRHGKLRIDRRGIRDEARYLLQFPLVEKREWLSVIKPGKTEHFSINKVAVDVKTPAGEWDTAVVVRTVARKDAKNEQVSFHYFVPKVGLVKIETFIRDINSGKSKKMTTTLLISYILK